MKKTYEQLEAELTNIKECYQDREDDLDFEYKLRTTYEEELEVLREEIADTRNRHYFELMELREKIKQLEYALLDAHLENCHSKRLNEELRGKLCELCDVTLDMYQESHP